MYSIYQRLCQEKGLTNYRVSKETGVSQSSLSEWKRGNSVPKYESMKKIADYFGVSVDYLLGKTDNKKTPRPEGQDVTFDDFTYAMYEEARELSNENKQKLLEMAQFFKQQQAKEKG